MEIEGVGVGVLEEIEGCHTHQDSKEQNAFPHSLLGAVVFFPFPDLSNHIVSISFTFFVHVDKVHESSMCLLRLFWWSDVEDALQNHRNITLMEQAKWALFLKSFFEISEAIPWPRDHILFTFSLPTTQATLAKFTKEDPHWKIRLIPD